MQGVILPLHDAVLLFLHRVLIVVDAGLILSLAVVRSLPATRQNTHPESVRESIMSAPLIGAVAFLWGYLTIPNEPSLRKIPFVVEEELDLISRKLVAIISKNLVITSSDVTNEILRTANFVGRDFQGAYFADLDLEAADLRGTDFRDATLIRVNLSNANLCCLSADISDDTQSEPSRSCSNFTGARLLGVDFTEANLTHASPQLKLRLTPR